MNENVKIAELEARVEAAEAALEVESAAAWKYEWERDKLRAALEAVVKLRNGSRLYFVLNHHNGVTEELLRPEDKHTDMIVAALRPTDEQPAAKEVKE